MKRSGRLPRRKGFAAPVPGGPWSTLRRGQRIRPVSARRARENRERRAMAGQVHGSEPLCTVWVLAGNGAEGIPAGVLTGCRRRADDLHEMLRRSQGGSITDPAGSVPACRPCHDVLTFWPKSRLGWAYVLGLLASPQPAPGAERGAA